MSKDAIIPGFSVQPNNAPMVSPAAGAAPVVETSSTDVMDVSFDADVKLRQIERFPEMVTGQILILAFPNLQENGVPKLKVAEVHSLWENKGHCQNLTFRAPSIKKNPELAKKCAAAWGAPKIKFGAVVFIYKTDNAGNFQQIEGKVNGQLVLWVYGPDKQEQFKDIHAQWGLGKLDMQIKCTDSNFKKIVATPVNNLVWREEQWFSAEDQANIMNEAEMLYERLDGEFGPSLSDQQIEGLLAGIPLDKQNQGVVTPNMSPFSQPNSAPQIAGPTPVTAGPATSVTAGPSPVASGPVTPVTAGPVVSTPVVKPEETDIKDAVEVNSSASVSMDSQPEAKTENV